MKPDFSMDNSKTLILYSQHSIGDKQTGESIPDFIAQNVPEAVLASIDRLNGSANAVAEFKATHSLKRSRLKFLTHAQCANLRDAVDEVQDNSSIQPFSEIILLASQDDKGKLREFIKESSYHRAYLDTYGLRSALEAFFAHFPIRPEGFTLKIVIANTHTVNVASATQWLDGLNIGAQSVANKLKIIVINANSNLLTDAMLGFKLMKGNYSDSKLSALKMALTGHSVYTIDAGTKDAIVSTAGEYKDNCPPIAHPMLSINFGIQPGVNTHTRLNNILDQLLALTNSHEQLSRHYQALAVHTQSDDEHQFKITSSLHHNEIVELLESALHYTVVYMCHDTHISIAHNLIDLAETAMTINNATSNERTMLIPAQTRMQMAMDAVVEISCKKTTTAALDEISTLFDACYSQARHLSSNTTQDENTVTALLQTLHTVIDRAQGGNNIRIVALVKFVASKGIDPSLFIGRSSLIYSNAPLSHYEVLHCKDGYSPSNQPHHSYSAIDLAIYQGNHDVVKELLEANEVYYNAKYPSSKAKLDALRHGISLHPTDAIAQDLLHALHTQLTKATIKHASSGESLDVKTTQIVKTMDIIFTLIPFLRHDENKGMTIIERTAYSLPQHPTCTLILTTLLEHATSCYNNLVHAYVHQEIDNLFCLEQELLIKLDPFYSPGLSHTLYDDFNAELESTSKPASYADTGILDRVTLETLVSYGYFPPPFFTSSISKLKDQGYSYTCINQFKEAYQYDLDSLNTLSRHIIQYGPGRPIGDEIITIANYLRYSAAESTFLAKCTHNKVKPRFHINNAMQVTDDVVEQYMGDLANLKDIKENHTTCVAMIALFQLNMPALLLMSAYGEDLSKATITSGNFALPFSLCCIAIESQLLSTTDKHLVPYKGLGMQGLKQALYSHIVATSKDNKRNAKLSIFAPNAHSQCDPTIFDFAIAGLEQIGDLMATGTEAKADDVVEAVLLTRPQNYTTQVIRVLKIDIPSVDAANELSADSLIELLFSIGVHNHNAALSTLKFMQEINKELSTSQLEYKKIGHTLSTNMAHKAVCYAAATRGADEKGITLAHVLMRALRQSGVSDAIYATHASMMVQPLGKRGELRLYSVTPLSYAILSANTSGALNVMQQHHDTVNMVAHNDDAVDNSGMNILQTLIQHMSTHFDGALLDHEIHTYSALYIQLYRTVNNEIREKSFPSITTDIQGNPRQIHALCQAVYCGMNISEYLYSDSTLLMQDDAFYAGDYKKTLSNGPCHKNAPIIDPNEPMSIIDVIFLSLCSHDMHFSAFHVVLPDAKRSQCALALREVATNIHSTKVAMVDRALNLDMLQLSFTIANHLRVFNLNTKERKQLIATIGKYKVITSLDEMVDHIDSRWNSLRTFECIATVISQDATNAQCLVTRVSRVMMKQMNDYCNSRGLFANHSFQSFFGLVAIQKVCFESAEGVLRQVAFTCEALEDAMLKSMFFSTIARDDIYNDLDHTDWSALLREVVARYMRPALEENPNQPYTPPESLYGLKLDLPQKFIRRVMERPAKLTLRPNLESFFGMKMGFLDTPSCIDQMIKAIEQGVDKCVQCISTKVGDNNSAYTMTMNNALFAVEFASSLMLAAYEQDPTSLQAIITRVHNDGRSINNILSMCAAFNNGNEDYLRTILEIATNAGIKDFPQIHFASHCCSPLSFRISYMYTENFSNTKLYKTNLVAAFDSIEQLIKMDFPLAVPAATSSTAYTTATLNINIPKKEHCLNAAFTGCAITIALQLSANIEQTNALVLQCGEFIRSEQSVSQLIRSLIPQPLEGKKKSVAVIAGIEANIVRISTTLQAIAKHNASDAHKYVLTPNDFFLLYSHACFYAPVNAQCAQFAEQLVERNLSRPDITLDYTIDLYAPKDASRNVRGNQRINIALFRQSQSFNTKDTALYLYAKSLACTDSTSKDVMNKCLQTIESRFTQASANSDQHSIFWIKLLQEESNGLSKVLPSPSRMNTATVVSNKLQITPLMFAVSRKCVKMVEILLEHGADPNYTNSRNNATPLQLAMVKVQNDPDYKEILTALISAVNNCDIVANNTGETLLITAIKSNQVNNVRLLLSKHVNINKTDRFSKNTPLMSAIQTGNLQMVEILLNESRDRMPYAIEYARAQEKYNHERQQLLKQKIHTLSKDNTLSEQVSETTYSTTLLYRLVTNLTQAEREELNAKYPPVIKPDILHHPQLSVIDIDLVNASGASALTIAIQNGHKELACKLIKEMQANLVQDIGQIPLLALAQIKDPELANDMATTVIDAANTLPPMQSNTGITTERTPLCKMIDIGCTRKGAVTVLISAIATGKLKLIGTLLANGASIEKNNAITYAQAILQAKVDYHKELCKQNNTPELEIQESLAEIAVHYNILKILHNHKARAFPLDDTEPDETDYVLKKVNKVATARRVFATHKVLLIGMSVIATISTVVGIVCTLGILKVIDSKIFKPRIQDAVGLFTFTVVFAAIGLAILITLYKPTVPLEKTMRSAKAILVENGINETRPDVGSSDETKVHNNLTNPKDNVVEQDDTHGTPADSSETSLNKSGVNITDAKPNTQIAPPENDRTTLEHITDHGKSL